MRAPVDESAWARLEFGDSRSLVRKKLEAMVAAGAVKLSEQRGDCEAGLSEIGQLDCRDMRVKLGRLGLQMYNFALTMDDDMLSGINLKAEFALPRDRWRLRFVQGQLDAYFDGIYGDSVPGDLGLRRVEEISDLDPEDGEPTRRTTEVIRLWDKGSLLVGYRLERVNNPLVNCPELSAQAGMSLDAEQFMPDEAAERSAARVECRIENGESVTLAAFLVDPWKWDQMEAKLRQQEESPEAWQDMADD